MEKVIKRNRKQVPFDAEKIKIALRKANTDVPKKHRLTEDEILEIVNYVSNIDKKSLGVEAIQDIITNRLVAMNKPELVNAYITFRYKHKLIRQANSTDDTIFELLGGTSEYWNTENSNKNAKVVTTQRDYIAGISSTDISERLLLPPDIVKAHKDGIIHFHDIDYFAQNALHNCDLINLRDMLENGTMINGVMIERPHWLSKATTIATQIITAVASSQYGGCSINLADLAPFVRDSYDKYYNKYLVKRKLNMDTAKEYALQDLKDEIESAVQTFNYQINSMSTTNGQAPFITVFMYLNQAEEYKEELALLIEEFLKQRIKGMKNRQGVYVTQAFPKLIYVLEEDNISEDSKYWELTKLAAKCTAKRLVPDYISEKVMKSLKHSCYGTDDCYAVMGCRSALTPDRFSNRLGNIANAKDYEPGKPKYSGRLAN